MSCLKGGGVVGTTAKNEAYCHGSNVDQNELPADDYDGPADRQAAVPTRPKNQY